MITSHMDAAQFTVRMLLRYALALRVLAGVIGIPAAILCAVAWYYLAGSATAVTWLLVLTVFGPPGGAVLVAGLLDLAAMLVRASAYRLLVSVSPPMPIADAALV